MALVNMKDLLNHAYNHRYAVGAFDIGDLTFLHAIIEAADRSCSPVILNIIEAHFNHYDIGHLMTAVEHAARQASIPVAIHMDCSSLESVQRAISLGSNSVMFDASQQDFSDNVEKTRQAAILAHSCGVPIGGKHKNLARIFLDDDNIKKGQSVFKSILEIKEYVERTGIDFLAITDGIHNGHKESRIPLDSALLLRIRKTVDIPLVINGHMGLTSNQYHKLIDHGVTKINYFTPLEKLAIKQIKDNLSRDCDNYRDVFLHINKVLVGELQNCMKIWRSAEKAADVLLQCGVWYNVEHVIVYNTTTDDQQVNEEMMHKGIQLLRTIPGVRSVKVGKCVNEHGSYRYCWLIRFANASVIETYKTHPVHIQYADNFFRPIAADRITNDYEILDDLELSRLI